MKDSKIKTIIVLLDDQQLNSLCYDLIDRYKDEFGRDSVYHIPIKDYTYIDKTKLHNYLFPILEKNKKAGIKSLVHCAGGIGRTGHILSAWLVYSLGYSIDESVKAVQDSGRDPLEATYDTNEDKSTLLKLLKSCIRT
jgi:protein-tyrosine phosphatase